MLFGPEDRLFQTDWCPVLLEMLSERTKHLGVIQLVQVERGLNRYEPAQGRQFFSISLHRLM